MTGTSDRTRDSNPSNWLVSKTEMQVVDSKWPRPGDNQRSESVGWEAISAHLLLMSHNFWVTELSFSLYLIRHITGAQDMNRYNMGYHEAPVHTHQVEVRSVYWLMDVCRHASLGSVTLFLGPRCLGRGGQGVVIQVRLARVRVEQTVVPGARAAKARAFPGCPTPAPGPYGVCLRTFLPSLRSPVAATQTVMGAPPWRVPFTNHSSMWGTPSSILAGVKPPPHRGFSQPQTFP